MMVSVQEPAGRKRLLPSEGPRAAKKLRNNEDPEANNIADKPAASSGSFNEVMYLKYVKSALDALDIVCKPSVDDNWQWFSTVLCVGGSGGS